MVQFDRAARSGRVEITIDMASVNSGVPPFDGHLRSKDILNVAEHPTARFVGDKFTFAGDKVTEVAGTLTMLGKTHPGDAEGHPLQLLPEPDLQARGLRRRLRSHASSAACGAWTTACRRWPPTTCACWCRSKRSSSNGA